jgi:hypothetical protein
VPDPRRGPRAGAAPRSRARRRGDADALGGDRRAGRAPGRRRGWEPRGALRPRGRDDARAGEPRRGSRRRVAATAALALHAVLAVATYALAAGATEHLDPEGAFSAGRAAPVGP